MIFLAGARAIRWTNRHGRMYLRAQDYLADFEKVYGAHGILPALDGADHFRFRKAMAPAHSLQRLEGQIDELYRHAHEHMANWQVGEMWADTKDRPLAATELPALTILRPRKTAQKRPRRNR